MSVIVPPGGFAGLAQMTSASRAAWGKTGGTKRRKKSKSAKKTKRKSTTKRKSKGRKPKFGSPAWRKKYLKK